MPLRFLSLTSCTSMLRRFDKSTPSYFEIKTGIFPRLMHNDRNKTFVRLFSTKIDDTLDEDGNARTKHNKGPLHTVQYKPVSQHDVVKIDKNEDENAKPIPTTRFIPTLETVLHLPVSLHEANNDVLITVASMGDKDALAELLKRHIMQIDQVEYEDAERTFGKIAAANRRGMILFSIPNKLGLTFALAFGFGSLPMIFDKESVLRFNDKWVTTDIPEPADMETMLEIGIWSWNWMEPVLGTLSFFLLCLQFGRAQLKNLGLRPFSMKVKQIRAQRLVQEFPRYDRKLLMAYSNADNYYN